MNEISVLMKQAQEGDCKAREVLIEKNLGLVRHIVKRFAGRGYDMEDLFQIGCIGLIKAIDKFDLSYEVRFSTYAVPMITGEIKRFLRDDGLIRVSRTLKENGWKVKQAAQKLAHSLGRDATLTEIAEETGQRWCSVWKRAWRWNPSTRQSISRMEMRSGCWIRWPLPERRTDGRMKKRIGFWTTCSLYSCWGNFRKRSRN